MSDIIGKTSAESLEKAQSGDSKSIETILVECRGLVEAIAKKYSDSPVEHEDLVQEGMIGLFKAVRSFDKSKGASFRTYANTCIDNAVQSAVRKVTRQKDIPKNDVVEYQEEDIPISNSESSAEDEYIRLEMLERLSQAIYDRLSKFEQDVFALYMSGLSYGDIAEKLGKTEKSVDNALQRIKNKLIGTV